MFVNTALTRRVVLAQLKNLRSTRGLNTSSVQGERAVHPGYQKVKELQKIYQVDNGLRIDQRQPASYQAMKYALFALTAVNGTIAVHFWYTLIFPSLG